MQISGSTVLLTGATGGIGHAIARALAGRGANLILTGRRADVLEPLAAECGGRALAVDLAVPDEVERLVKDAGEVDILVANAALPASGTLDSFSVQEIDRALAVNLRAPMSARARTRPGDGREGSRPSALHVLAAWQGRRDRHLRLQRQQVRVAWVRLRVAGRSARRRRRRIGGLPRHHPRRGDVRRCERGRADRCRHQFA